MAKANNVLKIIKEGKAQLSVPKTVFYNPVQEFNRDMSVFVLRTYLKHNVWHHKSEERHVKKRGGMKLLDALSASGLRSIRYAKELGPSGSIIKSITANDLSEEAVKIIKQNIADNQVEDKVVCSNSDATFHLYLSSKNFDDRYHVIDLDPFGTGAQFFDAAVKSIGEAGLLMITCTDTAVLCGNSSESCFARYGSMSLKSDCCHEIALRIILRSLESHAAVYGRYIKPLMSMSVDFYVRVYVQVFTQPAETKRSASKLSNVYLCKNCKSFELNPLGTTKMKDDPKQAESQNPTVKFRYKPGDVLVGDKCSICGGSYSIGGPIWSDPIHDQGFMGLLKSELALPETQQDFATFRRMQGMINLCSEELDTSPLFYSVDSMSSTLQMRCPKGDHVKSALLNAGFKVSACHTSTCGIKTDAPNRVMWDIMSQESELQPLDLPQPEVPIPKSEIARQIMANRAKTDYDFTYNPAVEPESKKLSMLRFQVNPTSHWGPKSRPLKATDENERPTESSISKTNELNDEPSSKNQLSSSSIEASSDKMDIEIPECKKLKSD